MPQSARTRPARIRAKATGQRYQRVLQGPDEQAKPGQRELEGAFFSQLRTLRFTPRGSDPSAYGIVRVEPRDERLTIHFGPGTDITDVRDRILPVIEDCANPDTEMHGLPGLRVRRHKAGTSLYRPGIAGEIVIAGVRPQELEPVSAELASWAGRNEPAAWTREERLYAKRHAPTMAGLDIESAILRRIGLLTATGAYSIESWRSHPSPRIVVELAFDRLAPEQAESLRDEMTSTHLAPHLQLDDYRAPRIENGGGSILLSLPDAGQTAEVRLMIRPRIIALPKERPE
ncbi:hypothetical protein [Sinomonas sp. G460-2]|uniref:hypothetical protein n=1 Tax=Sinomonas sp. G460-2 TaxID=3393464 RepID=UPI0039F03B6F